MKKTIALLLILILSMTLFAGCGGKTEESVDEPTSAPELTSAPVPEEDLEEEEDANRAVWNGFSVSLVDGWYVDGEGFQYFDLRQETGAFDVPRLSVRYLGGAAMSPAWYIEEKASQDWVQEEGEIQWADNITVNGIEYLVAAFAGNRYKTFWLFAVPGVPDKDFNPADSAYLVLEFEWTDLTGAMSLLETVKIDWSAAP
ncbi:MAG: hypothetical protein FWE69_04590 [Clostridiales bacterium]|nr:hypothetical protein [Clostridiales bacterium]